MKLLRNISIILTLTATPIYAQTAEVIANPAINPETVQDLQQKIADLELQLSGAQQFVAERKPELLDLNDKVANADRDTQKIIDDLKLLVAEFKTGSDVQLAVESSMQDVKGYIDQFRAGSDAEQQAAESLQASLKIMETTDERRNVAVGDLLAEIRRLEAMKGDLVAYRIAGSFGAMAKLYDEMVSEFEATVTETIELNDALESVVTLPVQ